MMHLTLAPLFLALTTALTTPLPPRQVNTNDHTMGFIGCSMSENVATGYTAAGGKHMWGPYGTGGLVVQSWTDNTSPAWAKFDAQAARYGLPPAVWVQICIFSWQGATYDEVTTLVANARRHAAPGARVYVTGQPVYPDNPGGCFLAGADGPQLTVDLAKRAGADAELDVAYPGEFELMQGEVADGCHANQVGEASLGRQAIAFWG
jgi:hypothetical protein